MTCLEYKGTSQEEDNMEYIKTTWKDRLVERPNTFEVQENPDGTITLIPTPGTVTQAGTPVNATNLNKIEDGIATLETNVTTHLAEDVSDVDGVHGLKNRNWNICTYDFRVNYSRFTRIRC